MKQLKNGQRVYSDATMTNWTKPELIKHIRSCENNIQAAEEIINNQASYMRELHERLDKFYKIANSKSQTFGLWSENKVYCEDNLDGISVGNGRYGYRCSNCGGIFDKTPYCGGCGAKMNLEG